MLAEYIQSPPVLTRLQQGPAGPYLDGFTDWLKSQGYPRTSIRQFLWGIGPLMEWLTGNQIDIASLDGLRLDAYRKHRETSGTLCHRNGKLEATFLGVRHFARYLLHTGVVPCAPRPEAAEPPLLAAFREWMQAHRGVREATLIAYGRVITDLLAALGSSPQRYEAKTLRGFVLRRASEHGIAKAKNTVTAARMFLRFLIATDRCRVGLDAAVPVIANWRLSSLPRYLTPSEVERLIASCDERTVTPLRDQAILLLLAHLALRAGDVAHLTFDDFDWTEARVRIAGKGRHEVWLPLPQRVGDAVLAYLQDERPAVAFEHVFIKAVAPYRPVASYLVSTVVRRAMARAEIDAPSRGAHLLRHSAATAMLQEGATLHEIAAVLRHVSIETTYHYAKVDQDLLRMVAAPWPASGSVMLPEVPSAETAIPVSPEVPSC
jgi:integrase/recombinase XerD